MPNLLAAFPSMIRAELKRRDMTQKELGAELDICGSSLTRLLNNRAWCDMPTFLRLCEWLQLDPLIIGDEQWMAAYQRGRDDVTAAVLAAVGGDDDA